MGPRADAIIYGAVIAAPVIGAALIGITLLAVGTVVLLDRAARKFAEVTHEPRQEGD